MKIRLKIAGDLLRTVFDECDQYEDEETGGRIIGHYSLEDNMLEIRANGVIEPGPGTRRTRTSLFQDGEYQTRIFRRLEERDPTIEHLGSWHTHHVNGYPRLSDGDLATYRRIVNHELHNPDFFYALLVVRRNYGESDLQRYDFRHYIFFREDDKIHEINSAEVQVTDSPVIWPLKQPTADDTENHVAQEAILVRARDKTILEVIYPSFAPRLNSRTETFYWTGRLPLIDGFTPDVKVVEIEDEGDLHYYPLVSAGSERAQELSATAFPSAAHAIRALELRLNQAALEFHTTDKQERMEVLTLYVGQGSFAVVRHGKQAIVVDTRWPSELRDEISSTVDHFLKHRKLAGVVLTGLDNDHADPDGLDWLLEDYEPEWVMYPKYYKDTFNATRVFNVIRKHVRRRENTNRPIRRVSVRLDRLDSRLLPGLTQEFKLELFSPHIQDMDNSNNCSIVLKIAGVGLGAFSYLVTGDTENSRWDVIVNLFGDALKTDLLAAPHHGSKNAAHTGMILAASPHTVIISAGIDNQYGHPHRKTARLYLKVAKHVFLTNAGEGISLLTYMQDGQIRTQRLAEAERQDLSKPN
ncbi:MAG: hypothetical protein OXM02_04330 [Bacteroidota bacterium]|nr:hypothetical protein [Bacteroidota bacterium]